MTTARTVRCQPCRLFVEAVISQKLVRRISEGKGSEGPVDAPIAGVLHRLADQEFSRQGLFVDSCPVPTHVRRMAVITL